MAELIAWWIDPETGLPIPSRAGVLRWFIRVSDALIWGDTAEALKAEYEGCIPKSLTFVPAKLDDNQALVRADPGYRANLMSLPLVERERLLGGNWKIRPAAGLYFQRRWCEVVDAVPAGLKLMRGWDLAGTEKTENNDPDWTAGTKIGKSADGTFYVVDQIWERGSPQKVRDLIKNTATQDGKSVAISLPQDPAQAGKAQALDFVKMLAGWNVTATVEARNTGDQQQTPSRVSAKITRFSPFSAQAEGGNVKILRGDWNTRFFEELEAFPDARHDDCPDSVSRAFAGLIAPPAPTRQVNIPFMSR